MGADVGWPLADNQLHLLGELATIIARGGSWRFLHGPVVAADAAHYPDAWEETRAGVARVIARTLWHAHLTIDATLDDVRRPTPRERRRLRDTHVELARVDARSAELVMSSVGNDDVAGMVAHEVGRTFVGWLAASGHPFRTAEGGVPDPVIGSIATVYLGLGVVAANAAHHPRSAGEVSGQMAYHEHTIAQLGGLAVDELAFLLAVQATVRDDVLTARDTLRPTQAAAVDAWCDVLDAHEDELAQLLGIAERAPDAPPARPAAPVPVAIKSAFDEADLHKTNLGQPVFRVPAHLAGLGAALGAIAGLVGFVIFLATMHEVTGELVPAWALIVLAVAPPVGGLIGFGLGRRRRFFRCATCQGVIARASDPVCRACGGRIIGDIVHARERLAREEELEEELDAEGTTRDG